MSHIGIQPHSVKHGPPLRTEAEIKQYMTTKPELGPLGTGDEDQLFNTQLLQIISKGIDDIVIQLKNRLGSNFTESNENAKTIIEMINTLDSVIKNDIRPLQTLDQDSISLDVNNTIKTGSKYLIAQKKNGTFLDTKVDDINIDDTYDFKTLNSEYKPIVNEQINLLETEITLNPTGVEDIQRRLKNCQNLEFLYLKKHDEIMKIFAFTINLFDKYKYAIKVMLFLLKHLVYKDEPYIPVPTPISTVPLGSVSGSSPPIEPKIKLPLTIIKNIKKLLRDQQTVQLVINKMDDAIIKTDPADPKNPTDPLFINKRDKLQEATTAKVTSKAQVDENIIDSKI